MRDFFETTESSSQFFGEILSGGRGLPDLLRKPCAIQHIPRQCNSSIFRVKSKQPPIFFKTEFLKYLGLDFCFYCLISKKGG